MWIALLPSIQTRSPRRLQMNSHGSYRYQISTPRPDLPKGICCKHSRGIVQVLFKIVERQLIMIYVKTLFFLIDVPYSFHIILHSMLFVLYLLCLFLFTFDLEAASGETISLQSHQYVKQYVSGYLKSSLQTKTEEGLSICCRIIYM